MEIGNSPEYKQIYADYNADLRQYFNFVIQDIYMYLFINNLSDENESFLALIGQENKVIARGTVWCKNNQSENILHGIDKLLAQIRKKVRDIDGIIVVNGPGSFVGIRIALSIANTMAWANNIPAVGVNIEKSKDNKALMLQGLKKLKSAKKTEPVSPFYGGEPHVTIPIS